VAVVIELIPEASSLKDIPDGKDLTKHVIRAALIAIELRYHACVQRLA
jgi:hypothetical protein